MLSIRLTRIGRRNRPFYRVVVADSRRSRDGRFIEVLGHYDPVAKPTVIDIDTEKIEQWVGKGAKLSDTVNSLVKQFKGKDKTGTETGTAVGVQQEVKE
jgi:small subunit ribosomal protein S16